MSLRGFYRHRYTHLKVRYDMPIKSERKCFAFGGANLWAWLVMVVLLVFVSCGKPQDPEDGLAIFKYNESAGILTLDPIYAKDLPHIWACNQVFNSLVAFDDKMDLVPMVAKSWETARMGWFIRSICAMMCSFMRMLAFISRPFDMLRDLHSTMKLRSLSLSKRRKLKVNLVMLPPKTSSIPSTV